LANVAEERKDVVAMERLLVLSARTALELNLRAIAEGCRDRIARCDGEHFLVGFDSAAEAFSSAVVLAYADQLRRYYPFEKAEFLLEKYRDEGYEGVHGFEAILEPVLAAAERRRIGLSGSSDSSGASGSTRDGRFDFHNGSRRRSPSDSFPGDSSDFNDEPAIEDLSEQRADDSIQDEALDSAADETPTETDVRFDSLDDDAIVHESFDEPSDSASSSHRRRVRVRSHRSAPTNTETLLNGDSARSPGIRFILDPPVDDRSLSLVNRLTSVGTLERVGMFVLGVLAGCILMSCFN
jgi:hypothetical protein